MYPRFHVEQKNWQLCSSNNVLVLHLLTISIYSIQSYKFFSPSSAGW